MAMNPNDTFIAPGSAPVPGKKSDKKFFMIIIGCLVGAVIIGLTLMALGGGNSSADKLATLNARLSALQQLTADSTSYLRAESVVNLNAELQLTLTTHQNNLQKNLGVPAPEDDQIALVADPKAATKLQDATTNGTYDRTYKQTVSQKLAAIMDAASQIYSSTKDQTLKDSMNNLYTDFNNLATRLKDATL